MQQVGTRHRVVQSTHHRDEAAAVLQRTYPGIELTLPESPDPFLMRFSRVGDERLTTSELIVSGPAVARGALEPDLLVVGQVLAGRFSAEYPRMRVDPTRPFIRPGGPAVMRMADVHLRLVAFDDAAFHAAAERYDATGLGHRRLSGSAPVSEEAANAWRWTAAQLHDAVRDARAFDNPIIAAELFDLGVRTLLTCFAEPGSGDSEVDVRSAPSAVRRAISYLEEHAATAVTVPEVAAAARVSVRSLQAMFRRHLGVSPIEHLHAIRLESARRELLSSGGADGGTVRRVAERWGFGNSGRFARLYAARFHERPSDTLRGGR